MTDTAHRRPPATSARPTLTGTVRVTKADGTVQEYRIGADGKVS